MSFISLFNCGITTNVATIANSEATEAIPTTMCVSCIAKKVKKYLNNKRIATNMGIEGISVNLFFIKFLLTSYFREKRFIKLLLSVDFYSFQFRKIVRIEAIESQKLLSLIWSVKIFQGDKIFGEN